MKYFHLFIILLFSCRSFAQYDVDFKSNICRYKLTQKTTYLLNKPHRKKKTLQTTTTFDSLGNKTTEIDYNFSNIYETTYTYDTSNLLSFKIDYNVGSKKTKELETVYKYDSKNNLIETIMYTYDSLNMRYPIYKLINTYDHDKLIKSINQSPLDTLIDSFAYDKIDTNKILIYQINNGKVYDGHKEEIYNSNKSLVKSTYYAPNNNLLSITEYVYNDEGFVTTIKMHPNISTYKSSSEQSNNYTKHVISYNKIGLEKKWTCYTNKKFMWKIITIYK